MIIDEFLLDGAIEPFDMGIHLGCSRIGTVVRNLQLKQTFREVLLELAAIVGQYEDSRMREYPYPAVEELFCGF